MAVQPWEYRTETGSTGYDADLATDELLGSSYLVVDTGPWIFGRKVLLPTGVVKRIDTLEHNVYVDRTKHQIKAAPEYDDWF